MAAYDDAIEAVGRIEQAVVYIFRSDGEEHPIVGLCTGVSVDRAISDQPESVTQVAGTAGAQARIQLAAAGTVIDPVTSLPITISAHDLSPLSTHDWSTRDEPGYGVGWRVEVHHDLWVSGAWSSTQVFSGTVRSFALDDDGGASLLCQDASATMRGKVDLPAAGSSAARIHPLALIDLSLRSAGYYLTPPHPDAYLSVPGVGCSLPEIGEYVNIKGVPGVAASPWPSYYPTVPITAGGGVWNMTETRTAAQIMTVDAIEGWFLGERPASPTNIMQIDGGIDLLIQTTGQLALTGPGSLSVSSVGLFPSGGIAWHYIKYQNGQWQVDAATSSDSPIVGSEALTNKVVTNWSTLGLYVGPTPTPSPMTWTPNLAASIDDVPQRLTGIARADDLDAWQTIKQVAAAYGDVAYFDGEASFRYESRDTWRTKRIGAAERTLTGDRVLSGAPEWSDDSLRQSVTATYTQPQTKISTAAAPAWEATDIYTCPARSTATYDVALDYTVYAIKPAVNAHASGASSSWFYGVDASTVGDPAADYMEGVRVTIQGIASGLRITITNPHSVAAALWTPGDGGSIPEGPYLVVHGTTVTVPESQTITVSTGATTGGDLALEDNPWRQDSALTGTWIADIASALSVPQVMVPPVSIPADPRLTVGDVVSINDSRYMDVAHPFQVIGYAHDMSGDLHTTALTLRSCYPPTGWILGVTGRSELGTTTVLV